MITKLELAEILEVIPDKIIKNGDLWDIDTNVYITNDLIENGMLKVKFGYVNGNFYCSTVPLTITFIPSNFNVDVPFFNWHLTGLDYLKKNNRNINLTNKLKTLLGSPHTVKGYFVCSQNELTDLNYAPKYVGEKIICYHNGIKSVPDYIDIEKINFYDNPYHYFKKYNYEL